MTEAQVSDQLACGPDVKRLEEPISPKPDLAKVRTHEAVHRHLATGSDDHARILCGDLNTPLRASIAKDGLSDHSALIANLRRLEAAA